MEKRPSLFTAFFTIFRPGLILAVLLTTLLGLGIARQLAVPINISNAILGFVLVILLLESRAFLEAFYRHPTAPENRMAHNTKVDDPYLAAVEQFQRPALLYISIVILGAGAFLTTVMAVQGQLSPSVYLLLGVGFLLCFFSSVPPVELSERGYAEVVESLLVTLLAPALTLALQMRELHLLVILLSLPLTFVYLALRIVKSLETYGRDSLLKRQVMLLRIGWQKGMNLHNFSLIGSYLLTGIFALLLLPWSLTWPYLLSLPFAVFQIFQVQQIANGARPNWRLLNLAAAATFGVTAYSITLTLWIR
ncbi:MAG TPA: hypothetical protein DDW19_01150 [Anaerolineaceae bacterium]|jgi:1,4-dihydroxy-2-naphthoate octaprenyltransferase|nr:hypothetical protein [Anaerolineaceae bacterium]